MITQGDNTQNFDNHFLKLTIKNPYNQPIAKAIFQSGQVQKEYENPESILYIDFTEDETRLLKHDNVGYLMVYDSENRPVTCKGCVHFKCLEGKIYV